MANNPYISKVIYGATVLVDLTGDTVTAGSMLSGYSAHDKSGASISGSIATKSSTDVTVSNDTVTIPAGYYSSAVSKSVNGTSISQIPSTVDGSTATLGTATWSAGYISAGSIPAASFTNAPESGQTYLDISNTSAAPVLVSGGYLHINKGIVTTNLKISVAKLVPDGASANLSSAVILSGYSAYNNDGILVSGSIPTKTSTDVTVSQNTVTIPAGYYASQVEKSIALGTLTQGAPTIDSTTGIVTATATVTAGYHNADTDSNTLQLTTQASATITPTRNTQTAVAAGKYTLGAVEVAPIPNNYYLLEEIYTVGYMYVTNTNTNPASSLGFGTWTLINKSFVWNNLLDDTWQDIEYANWSFEDEPDTLYIWIRTA